jgi:two-component system invasion response regulator UvrY
MAQVRVLTVDDQAVFREAVRDLLDDTPGFEPVGEASCGPDAIAAVASTATDLVLLDVRMPGMDGIETARRITAQDPDVVIVLVSADEPEDLPAGATSCGAVAYVPKRDLGPRRLTRLWASIRR